MGLRRRRRQLTTLLTNIDRRLRNVERRRAPKQIFPLAITGDLIEDGTITEDKLDIDSTDVDANTGIKGPDVPTFFIGITTAKMENSGSFSIPATCTINLNGDHNFEVGNKVIITGTTYYDGTWNVDSIPSSSSFTFKREYWNGGLGDQPLTSQSVSITNKVCTTTVATLTTSSAHNFQVDDEILISGVGEPFDGVFTVAAVPDDTSFMYKFITAQTAVPSASASGTAKAVVIKYGKVGDTWVDTNDQSVYAWTGLRWELVNGGIPEGLFIPDDIAPKAPTSLVLTTQAYFSNGEPKASVNVTWTAPTQNVDDTELTDLLGYEVYYKYNSANKWVLADSISLGESLEGEVLDLTQNTLVYISVRAYDSSGNRSAYARISEGTLYSITTGTSSLSVSTPDAPTLSTRLGTISVSWNGKLSGGAPPKSFSHVEVHMSTVNEFTPTTSTLIGLLFSAGEYIVGGTDLVYNTTYYFKFIAVDKSGNKTNASSQAFIATKPLVDVDLIANTLTTWPFANGTVSAGALASGAINASNLFGDNVIVQSAIAADAIGANQIAAGSIIAGKIGADAVTANTIAAAAVTAGKIATNAVTAEKIEAGAVTAIKIDANAINGKIITGSTIRTSASNPRVEINTGGLFSYDSSGNIIVKIDATSGLFKLDGVGSTGETSLVLRSNNAQISNTSPQGVITIRGTDWRTSFDANDIQTFNASSTAKGPLYIQRFGGNLEVGGNAPSNLILTGDLSVTGTGSLTYAINCDGQIEATRFRSTVADGTAPFVVTSKTTVENLSAERLSGYLVGQFLRADVSDTFTGAALTINGALNCENVYSRTISNGRSVFVGAAGGIGIASSSERFKQQISSVEEELLASNFLSLNAVKFKYNDDVSELGEDAPIVYGFIAEEAQSLELHQLYGVDKDNKPDYFFYERLPVYLFTVVKSQQKKIEELENRLDNL